jgi:hypothetical protein
MDLAGLPSLTRIIFSLFFNYYFLSRVNDYVRKRELFCTVYSFCSYSSIYYMRKGKHDPISQLTIAEYLLISAE